jgi:arylsulfatase A-like enzyme
MTEDEASEHRQQMDQVRSEIRDPFLRWHALPTKDELDRAGIDPKTYVAREKAWYDASIRAMDEEIGRLRQRLEDLGLGDTTLVVLTSDHGEEFLEHGRHFHGYTAYGEVLNVPLLFWWPDGLRPGLEVAQTVQTIDLLPTLLEISRLPGLPAAQGRSVLPLLAGGDPRALGWEPQPVFAERTPAPAEFGVYETDVESRAIIHGGWKLILHVDESDGTSERLELFRHRDDPLNLIDVSSEHQGTVQRLRFMLDDWHRGALAARIEPATDVEPLTPEERDRLRALGYLE